MLFNKSKKPPRFDLFPFQLIRRRIYIIPNKSGLLLGLILAVMLFGSINYNNNMGFIFTFLLASMVVVSTFHSYRNLAGLTLNSPQAHNACLGEKIKFSLWMKTTVI